MMTRTFLFGAALCGMAGAETVRSGHAEIGWLAASGTYQAGEPIETIFRMKLDKGWHTYWSNPGEGGMKISVAWTLPDGWKAGELRHPVPIRFMTGELPGFGYEGTVEFPVTLTPPAVGDGTANLKAEVSWLTCDDSACVPGNAELSLILESGPPSTTPAANAIAKAKTNIPQAAPEGFKLFVVSADAGKSLTLTLETPADFDLSECEIFPETPQVVDPGADFVFRKSDAGWTAKVAANEYANGAPKELALVIAGKAAASPFFVIWKAE